MNDYNYKSTLPFDEPEVLPSIKDGLTKSDIAKLATISVDNVLEHGGIAKAVEGVAAMEEFTKAIRKDERFSSYMRDELSKSSGTIKTPSGAKIEACEAAISYDYSGNPDWCALQEERAALDEKIKALEAKLRAIPAGKMLVDEDTGEVLQGPLKTSKSTYRITLAK